MDLPKVEGTQVRGKIYHLNLRIKPEIQDLYGGKSHLRGSLRTSDPKVARLEVRRHRAELLEKEQERARQAEVEDLVAQLSPEKRAAYDAAGGLEGLLEGFERRRTGAGAASDLADEEPGGHDIPSFLERSVSRLGRAAPEPAEEPQYAETDPTDDWRAEAVEDVIDEDWPLGNGSALTVVPEDGDGYDDLEDEMFTIADLFEEYAPTLEPEAAEALRLVVRLFSEFHGDIAYDELTIAHLDEFAVAAHGLPADMMARLADGTHVRDLPFAELVAWTVHTDAKPISETMRFQYVALLKELMDFGVPRYRRGDPWSEYRLQIVRRETVEPEEKRSTRRFAPPSEWTLSAALMRLLELGIGIFVLALMYLLWQSRH